MRPIPTALCARRKFDGPFTSAGLHHLEIVFYAEPTSGFDRKTMQRFTARLLLLFALAGTFVPVALQATAVPPHACCRRNAAHHCPDSETRSDEPVLRDIGCCSHDCRRAIATSQWAHPEPLQSAATIEVIRNRQIALSSIVPLRKFASSQSSRAPPQSPSL